MDKATRYLFEYDGKQFFHEDVVQALKAVGVGEGDKLFIHSNIASFGKVNPDLSNEVFLDSFVEALTGLVGARGTIIMPTFSYSFTRGDVYDPQDTPSSVGSLTEYFRKLPGVVRTADGIFSVALWGADQEFYQDVGLDCFGDRSIFQKIYDANFKILFLGETFHLTFLHYIEQCHKIPYRFFKQFTGKIRLSGELREKTFTYFVRYLDGSVECDLERIARFLDDKGVVRKSKLGYSHLRLVSARDAYDLIGAEVKKNPRFILKNEGR